MISLTRVPRDTHSAIPIRRAYGGEAIRKIGIFTIEDGKTKICRYVHLSCPLFMGHRAIGLRLVHETLLPCVGERTDLFNDSQTS